MTANGNTYTDVTSLKDARYAITADFLAKRKAPLWAIKYAPESTFVGLPVIVTITDGIKQLIDNIVRICMERELRNPALINETLSLISNLRIDVKNILNVESAFSNGFKAYLMQLSYVNVKEDEVDSLRTYIEQHLESTVGYWTEEEVEKKALQWRASQKIQLPDDDDNDIDDDNNNDNNNHDSVIKEKRSSAKNKIEGLSSLKEAKSLLIKLCDGGNESILDIINM